MVLGNMEIGVNTANLAGIVIVFLLAIVNIFGVRLGAMIQNIFTSAKALVAGGAGPAGASRSGARRGVAGELRPRLEQFWKNAGWSSLHPVQVGVGGPIVLVNLLVILAVVQVGSLFSADAWNNITFTAGEVKNPQTQHSAVADSGHGLRADGLLSCLAGVSAGAADARRSERRDCAGARHAVCRGRSRGDGGAWSRCSTPAARS